MHHACRPRKVNSHATPPAAAKHVLPTRWGPAGRVQPASLDVAACAGPAALCLDRLVEARWTRAHHAARTYCPASSRPPDVLGRPPGVQPHALGKLQCAWAGWLGVEAAGPCGAHEKTLEGHGRRAAAAPPVLS